MTIPGYHIIIPARMASQRLPGKPLVDIAGQTLIERVYRCAKKSSAQSVTIATDDQQVLEAARSFGARAVMTLKTHQSGTDRIAECVAARGFSPDEIVVNLQGDEPLMPASCLQQVAQLLETDTAADMASLYWPLTERADISDPNVVKVVVSASGAALYFSRLGIPFDRDSGLLTDSREPDDTWKRHIGLYAYRVAALQSFTEQSSGRLEKIEKLEQLRVLENGGRIAMAQACEPVPGGVDTPADLERLRQIVK